MLEAERVRIQRDMEPGTSCRLLSLFTHTHTHMERNMESGLLVSFISSLNLPHLVSQSQSFIPSLSLAHPQSHSVSLILKLTTQAERVTGSPSRPSRARAGGQGPGNPYTGSGQVGCRDRPSVVHRPGGRPVVDGRDRPSEAETGRRWQ